jgi:hypothetical protein
MILTFSFHFLSVAEPITSSHYQTIAKIIRDRGIYEYIMTSLPVTKLYLKNRDIWLNDNTVLVKTTLL